MRITPRATAFILILICLVPALAFAQRKARLLGKVVDAEGKPVQGVTVTATSPDIPKYRDVVITDKRGAFILDFRDVDVTYHYRFDKPGYQALDVNQEWHLEGTQQMQWTMAAGSPAGPAAAAAPPPTTSEPAVAAFNAGVTALKAKDYATAEARLKEAVQHDPKLARGWAALASVQVQAGHDQDAADAAEKAMALGVKDEVLLTARYQAYRNLKNDAKAAEALKDLESVGRAAEEAKKIHNEAVALVKAGDNAGAIAKFQDALKIDPNLEPALLGLATAQLKAGRNAEAATAAETVLKTSSANEQALRLRYNACLALGDADRLFDALQGLARVEPAIAAKGTLKLAFDAYDANDVTKAKGRFLKVLEIDPNQPLVHYYLGMLYVNEGATADAKKHLEQFVALSPNSKEAATARDILKQLSK